MLGLSKKILSTNGPQYTRVLIEEYFDRAALNEFIFSEAYLEKSKKDEELRIIIKAISIFRHFFPTKYKIVIEETEAGSEVIVKPGISVWRLLVVIAGLVIIYTSSSDAIFLNNYFFKIALFIAGIVLLICMSLSERNKVSKAIIESIN